MFFTWGDVLRFRYFEMKSKEEPNWRTKKEGDDRDGQVINHYRVGLHY